MNRWINNERAAIVLGLGTPGLQSSCFPNRPCALSMRLSFWGNFPYLYNKET